jgi:glycosyltransferase involved in cell wall biosynthesis
MRIAYDHSIFTIQEFGGVSRYFARLADHLRTPTSQPRIFAPIHINQYLTDLPPELVFGKRVAKYPKFLKAAARSLNFTAAQTAIKMWNPEVLHETYYGEHAMAQGKAARVVTIHDMITEIFPEKFSKAALVTKRKKQAIDRADHVICISENTRADLLKYLDVPPQKISVIHHGVDALPVHPTQVAKTEKSYFLYVGSRLEYKNFNVLLRAFATSKHLKQSFDIVAFGGGPATIEEKELISKLGLHADSIKFVAGSDISLSNFYRGACAFVYPTQYEGFGFPPLEAMALGCPVICSNSSCMPEVVGDAAVLFNPSSVDELRTALEKTAGSETLRAGLISLGKKRHALFSWSKCAEQTLAIYKSLGMRST